MRSIGIGLFALVCGALAQAAESRPTLVVVDFDSKGASSLQAEAATQAAARGLRELDVFQVLSSSDVRQLLALERSKELVGGSGEGAGQLAQALGARHVVAGTVTSLNDRISVELRLLDTAKGAVLNQKTLGPVDKFEAIALGLPGLTQELVGPLLEGEQGTLVVKSNEQGAELIVDGTLQGSTPQRTPFKLSRGAHRLQIRKDGFISQSRTIRIVPEQMTVEDFTLVPSADYAEAYRLRHGRLRVGAYVSTAAALGFGAAAFLFDRNVTEPFYRSQFLPRQAALNRQYLPESIRTDPSAISLYQQCESDRNACTLAIQGVQSQIILEEIATVALATVGVGSAALATYLWITGQDPNRYAEVVAGIWVGPSPGFSLAVSF